MSTEVAQRLLVGDFVLTKDDKLGIIKQMYPVGPNVEVFMNGSGECYNLLIYELRRVRIQPCVKIYDFETGELIVERNETL